jgi:hypothetical protein
MKSLTLFSYFMVIKLCSIIGYQDFSKSKTAYNVLPNEKDYFVGDYVCQCLNLYLFCEDCYQDNLYVTCGLREKTQDIHPSLKERSWKGYKCHLCWMLVGDWSVSFTSVASSSQFSDIIKNSWPVKIYSSSFDGESSWTNMETIYPFMKFFQNICCLLPIGISWRELGWIFYTRHH